MNELKIGIDYREAFEGKLRAAQGIMGEPYWVGNWYLESNPQRVLKVMQMQANATIEQASQYC